MKLLALGLAVIAAAVATGCASLNPFAKSYGLEIRPGSGPTSQLQSLYVIVSERSEVQEALLSESSYGDLLDRLDKYVSFVQYQPTEAGSWKLAYEGRTSSFVEYKIDDESIEVEVSGKLGGAQGREHCIVVLAFFGSEGYKLVTIDQASLDAVLSQVVEVVSGGLTLSTV